MDVRIGVTYSAREIEIDLGVADTETVKKEISAVLSGQQDILWLTDKRGRAVAVPREKIAYVEVGTDGAERRIGFVG